MFPILANSKSNLKTIKETNTHTHRCTQAHTQRDAHAHAHTHTPHHAQAPASDGSKGTEFCEDLLEQMVSKQEI